MHGQQKKKKKAAVNVYEVFYELDDCSSCYFYSSWDTVADFQERT